MKTILTFVGLNVLGILSVVFVPYWIGLAERRFLDIMGNGRPIWLNGFACITILFVGMGLFAILVFSSWKLANKITKN